MYRFFLMCCVILCCGCGSKSVEPGGYLFAHMKHSDYGGLYYYISPDGHHWEILNNDSTVEAAYRGHPDIMKGRDGRYYMIGVSEQTARPTLWISSDLCDWTMEKELPAEIFTDLPGYFTETAWYGAPKLFYDASSEQYLISWHAAKPGLSGNDEWKSMRTFYVLTKDFEHFTRPERLFDFKGETVREMATIDAIIRKIDGTYYAVIKDERWPEDAPSGKTVLIARSGKLTGPYSDPDIQVTPPGVFFEAPVLMPNLDGTGWMVFAEEYPTQYHCFEAPSMESETWTEHPATIPNARHGAMVRISAKEYDGLAKKFGKQPLERK